MGLGLTDAANRQAKLAELREVAQRPEPEVEQSNLVAPGLDFCMRFLAGLDSDYARIRNDMGFSKFDVERGHRLARTPIQDWNPWDPTWAWGRTRYYHRQFEEAGIRFDLIPQPPTPARPEPVKEVQLREDGFFVVNYRHLEREEFERIRSACSQIRGRQWVHDLGVWLIPQDGLSSRDLREFAQRHGFQLGEGVTRRFHDLVDRATMMLEGSQAVRPFSDYEPNLADLEGSGLELWPHQLAGLDYMRRCHYNLMVADQMGTGKTPLTLRAAIDAGVFEKDDQGSRGMLVICPASVKLNWEREAKLWAPGKTVTVLSGGGLQDVRGDIVIANYDILRWNPNASEDEITEVWTLLSLRKFQMLVCDESHYLKSEDAQRTLAVKKLVEKVAFKYRLMLSGSPILNKVGEFVTALELLGMLDHFGGIHRFMGAYAGRYNTYRLKELNQKLREGAPGGGGYLCRLKEHHAFDPQNRFLHIDAAPDHVAPYRLRRRLEDEDQDRLQVEELRKVMHSRYWELVEGAMKLPAKIKAAQAIELHDRKAYDRVVHEFRQWLLEQILEHGGDISAWNRALKAEALVKLNKLREEVARQKVPGAIAWTRDFLDSSEEKMVLWIEHDDPMYRLLQAFPDAALITGGQSATERQRHIDRFQTDPDCRLLIGKIKAGGVGINLAAASTAAVLELPWNPGTLDQAEDRIHRGGQTRTVSIHYLLAERTIDQTMMELIDEKREVVTAATHGGDVESDSMLTHLLEEVLAA